MGTDFFIFTAVATIFTIMPVYKIRFFMARLLKIPILGWIINVGYGFLMSYILLVLFSFKSSVAGLANLTSTLLFALWLYFVRKQYDQQKQNTM